jgi:hypothetical protein
MFQVKPTFMGNPDRNQYTTPVKPKTFTANTLEALRDDIYEFLGDNDLGAGNWGTARVLKDGKLYGYMSYNGRIWDSNEWSPTAKEIKNDD